MKELTKTEEIIMLCIWNMKNDITLSTVMEALENEPRSKDWKSQAIST